MNHLQIKLLPLSALLAAAGLAGCNGSGDGVLPTSGLVIGSYYEGATVCLDANNNGKCDTGETSTVTDAKGAWTLQGTGTAVPVVAQITTSAIRHAVQGDAGTRVASPLTFRAPAGVANVSAISTELAALMADGTSLAAARTTLANRIGVAEDKLLADFNKEADVTAKAALQTESDRTATAIAAAGGDATNSLALDKIQTVVVIYAENRSFDNLYGAFPNADGIPANPAPQKDMDGTTLSTLPPIWGGLDAGVTVDPATAVKVTVPQASTIGWANKPYQIDAANGLQNTGTVVGLDVVNRDLYHRFYENQMQINPAGGSKSDQFAAWADSGAMVMGYFDGSKMKLWNLAKQYTLADNFFQGAFGGSFLNHQYLVCACAPEYPNADTAAAAPTIAAIDTDANGNFVRLKPATTSPTSVLNGAPTFQLSGNITPKAYAGNGKFYAVNTMQPPYQPSGNAPAGGASSLLANPAAATTLPPQAATTIGDLLTGKKVDWAWYAGAWSNVSALAAGTRAFTSPVPNFQFHHQPFNYYSRFDPTSTTGAAERAAHLKDFDSQFFADAAAGKLPAVSFYKPQGNLNQHAGYASVKAADDHIADVIARLQASPQWKNMLVVVTYDENGGWWDHKAVPKGDVWGPGSRIPALIISPYAKKGYVDHTQYDTASILRFLSRRFSLDQLPGLTVRDTALVQNGGKAMGDLTAALDFTQ